MRNCDRGGLKNSNMVNYDQIWANIVDADTRAKFDNLRPSTITDFQLVTDR